MRPNDIYDALKYVHYLCKITGIAPYTVNGSSKKRRYRVTRFDLIFSATMCALLHVIFVLGLKSCSKRYFIVIRAITTVTQRYTNVLMYLACYFGALINGKKFTRALSLIIKYDDYFLRESLASNITYERMRKRNLITLSIGLSITSIMLGIDFYDTTTRTTALFCNLLYSCSYTITAFMECQLYVVLIELKERLIILNNLITKRFNRVEELKNFSKIYDDYIDAGYNLNRYYELQILTKFFVLFLFTLSALYYFTRDMKIGPELEYLFDYIAFVYAVFMNFIEVIGTIYAFSTIDHEVGCFFIV